jgi:hypothetical protein
VRSTPRPNRRGAPFLLPEIQVPGERLARDVAPLPAARGARTARRGGTARTRSPVFALTVRMVRAASLLWPFQSRFQWDTAWHPHVVVDGNLVTGQQNFSAKVTALAVLAKLGHTSA